MADIRFLSPITILARIEGISIDVVKRREGTFEHIISQNPIEDGSPVTDHVTNLPPRIIIEGGFSDIRITNLIGSAFNSDYAKKGRAKEQFDRLLDLYTRRKSFNVMDGLHLYKDMQFKSLKEIKEKEGFSVMFTAEIWNIRKISVSATSGASKISSNNDAFARAIVGTQLLASVGATTASDTLLSQGILL